MSFPHSRTLGSNTPNNWTNKPSVRSPCVHFAERSGEICNCARIRNRTCPVWGFACQAYTCTRSNEGLWERIADPTEIAPTAIGTDTAHAITSVPVQAGGPNPALSETHGTVPRARAAITIRKRACATVPVLPPIPDSNIPTRIPMRDVMRSLAAVYGQLTSARLPMCAIVRTVGDRRMPVGGQAPRIVPLRRSEHTLKSVRTHRIALVRRRRPMPLNTRLPNTLVASGACRVARR